MTWWLHHAGCQLASYSRPTLALLMNEIGRMHIINLSCFPARFFTSDIIATSVPRQVAPTLASGYIIQLPLQRNEQNKTF